MACGGGGRDVTPGDRAAVMGTGTVVTSTATFGDSGPRVTRCGGLAYVASGDTASASSHDGVLLCVVSYFRGPQSAVADVDS